MTTTLTIKKARDSRFELLRIVAMVMIVAYHLVGPLPDKHHPLTTLDSWVTVALGSWGILGVNVFVLISCYFFFKKDAPQGTAAEMVKSTWHRKAKSVVVQTLTYIVAFTLLVPIFTKMSFSDMFRPFVVSMLNDPLFVNCYWFVSAYVALQFALPYVRKIPVTKQVFVVTNILLILSSESSTGGFISSFIQFLLFAVLVMHVMKVEKLRNFVRKYAVIGFVAITCFIILVSGLANTLNHSEFIKTAIGKAYGRDLVNIISHVFNHGRFSYLIVWDSIFLFGAFQKLHPFHLKWVNWISTLMFGVYLFHQFPNYLMTKEVVTFLRTYFTSNTVIFLVATILLMAGGMLVDALRKGLVHLLGKCKGEKCPD